MESITAYCSRPRPQAVAPPKFPAIRRDVALVLDRDFPVSEVTDAFLALDAPLLESVEPFDVFEGAALPSGKKSVAIACRYRGGDRTLTDEEVNRAHVGLVEQVAARLGADLRQ